MSIDAIIFGGIGTLVETSALQREAFNRAFEEAVLPWQWDRQTYRDLLSVAGGQNRIRHYVAARAETPSLSEDQIIALHARKTELFRLALSAGKLEPRAGVRHMINKARDADAKVAIASTTSAANIEALDSAAELTLDGFDAVLHRGSVTRPKPDPQVYEHCLRVLDVTAENAVAIEDSEVGVVAARTAGLRCIAFPGEYTAGQNFERATLIVNKLAWDPGGANIFAPSIINRDDESSQRLAVVNR